MSAPVTSLFPFTSRERVKGPSPAAFSRICLRLSTSSTTSSLIPSRVVNWCAAPRIRTEVIATPSSDESMTLRSAFPSVWPYPFSNGSRTRIEYPSLLSSDVTINVGWIMVALLFSLI